MAKEYEKRRREGLERAAVGLPSERVQGMIRSVSEICKSYLSSYPLGHRPNSIRSAENCLENVERLIGKALLSDLNEDVIRDYMRRQKEIVCGRTVNMDVAELSCNRSNLERTLAKGP